MTPIELINCNKSYKGNEIFSGISYKFVESVYFLKGKNGSGKSTLLRCICDIEKFSKGKIINNNKNFLYLTNEPLNHNYLTISENISLLFSIHSLRINKSMESVINSLYSSEQLETFSEQASLGMNLKIGCTLLAAIDHWDLIVLDETLSGVDKESRDILLDLLNKCVNNGSCAIIVSHNDIENGCKFNYKVLSIKGDKLCEEINK
ncbi:ATP-binding cassette domain-containing protein [Sporolactobacillus vineae]|nr:ATP-binding cassette domain-containing protein [Sporolactobacillus vineae]